MSGERERRIFLGLRVNLEILAQSDFQRQVRQSPERILHVKSVVRHAKRKGRVSRSLTEKVVFTERKAFQIRKFITAEERPELHVGIRVRAAKIVVRIPCTAEIDTELQRVPANHVVDSVRHGILPLKDPSHRKWGIA